MTIVFCLSASCGYVMKAPDEKGGASVKCLKCGLPQEVPYADAASWSMSGTRRRQYSGVVKPISKSNPPMPKPTMTPPPRGKADDLLEQAAARREAGELDAAVHLVRQA